MPRQVRLIEKVEFYYDFNLFSRLSEGPQIPPINLWPTKTERQEDYLLTKAGFEPATFRSRVHALTAQPRYQLRVYLKTSVLSHSWKLFWCISVVATERGKVSNEVVAVHLSAHVLMASTSIFREHMPVSFLIVHPDRLSWTRMA